jgi:hypothetical protein
VSGEASECGDGVVSQAQPFSLLRTSIARRTPPTAASFSPAATRARRAATLAAANDARFFRLDVD